MSTIYILSDKGTEVQEVKNLLKITPLPDDGAGWDSNAGNFMTKTTSTITLARDHKSEHVYLAICWVLL